MSEIAEKTAAPRVYVVTGAGSGIGRAAAARLTDQGHRVIGVDLRNTEVTADLSTEGGLATMAEEISGLTDVVDGVLRHLAVLLHEHGLLSESRVWSAAAAVLDDHRDRFPRHWDELDLFRESFAHSCLNRLQLRNPHRMVDLADPAGSLALAGRLANPLASHRAGAVPGAVAP